MPEKCALILRGDVFVIWEWRLIIMKIGLVFA